MGGKLEWSPSHKSENFWKVRRHLHRRRRRRRRHRHPTTATPPPPPPPPSPHRLLPLQDNHKAFEAENCAAIKTLVALLVPESDAQTLAVACHDIGEFVKHHPEGRRLMTQFGAKLAVMSILKHSNPEVQKHALTAVQRLMVINWDLLAVGK